MKKPALVAFALLASASVARAHPGGVVHDLAHGLAHPWLGLDHLLAALAVGLFAAQRGGRAVWLLPATFLLALVAGGAAGAAGVALPAVEPTLLASLLVLGLAVASAARPPLPLAVAATALFALAHGHAHGTESAGVAAFGGVVLSTAGLHALGLGLVFNLRRVRADRLVRLAGAATAVVGALLLLS